MNYRISKAILGVALTPCPHFYTWLGTGETPWVKEQQKRNCPNCGDHHKSAHQND